MKSIIFLFTFISIIFLIESCEPVVQSLHPLYTEDILIEEPYIEGIWYYKNNNTDTIYWEIKATEGKKYIAKVYDSNEKNKEVLFFLHLIKLKNDIYADLFPVEECALISDSDPGLFLLSHITPVHSFSKLTFSENKVEIQYFAAKWIKSILKKHKKCIDYKKINVGDCEGENCYLLTSPPSKLQKLIIKHGEENLKLQDNKILFNKLKTANN